MTEKRLNNIIISKRMIQYDLNKQKTWLNPLILRRENKQNERIMWKKSNEHTQLYEG